MASAPRACSERMATEEDPVAPTAVAAIPERIPAANAAVYQALTRPPYASSDGFPSRPASCPRDAALQDDDARH